jgi:hypothetical protein
LPGFDTPSRAAYDDTPAPELSEAPAAYEPPPAPPEAPAPPSPEASASVAAPTTDIMDEPAPAEPAADLVGSAPMAPVHEPLVSVQPPATVSRLVSAPSPPDMPLVQLPATPLPPSESQARRLVPALDDDAPAATAGLIGEARGIEPVVSAPALAPVDPSEAATPAGPAPLPADMPLAPISRPEPATGEAEDAAQESELTATLEPAPGSPFAQTDDVTAPVVGATEPISVLPPPAEPDEPTAATSPGETPDLPLAVAPTPTPVGETQSADADEDLTAPTLGERPVIPTSPAPLIAEAEAPSPAASPPADHPLASSPPTTPRRSGLGEPMSQLPPTATPMGIANMSRSQQVELSRSLIQSQMAARSRSLPIGQQLHQGAPAAATRGAEAAPDLPLARAPQAVVPIERLDEQSPGAVDADLPPAGADTAPLLSMDPLVGRQDVEAGPSTSPAPPEGASIRATIGQRHGVDLANVRVDRSERGAAQAHQLGARAFTSDLAVVIPSQAGSLDSGPGEALLAHELTHVAQRVRTGGTMPPESSPAGRMLEAEAARTELTLNLGGFVRPVLDAPAGAPGGMPGPGPSGVGTGSAALETASLPLAASAAAPGPDYDALATSIIQRMTTLTAPGYAQTEVFQAPSAMAVAAPEGAPGGAVGVQRAPIEVQTLTPVHHEAPPQPVEHTQPAPRPSDEDLSNLSRWLYPLIKFRLKSDLREDRERAGLLTDNYRRW